jgi:hypothetical protein
VQQQEQGLMVTPTDLRAAYRAPDARLLDLVRAGNTTAYDIVCTRHVEAARRLAHVMVAPAEADRVVAEAFAEVRDATLLGRGPSDAFRPYLLTALRRVGAGLQRTEAPAGTLPLPDPAQPASDPEATDLGTSPIVRAFRSLPESWIAVLWHTDMEKTSAADVTRILGVGLTGVAPLRRQALHALRQAYLQVRISEAADPECEQAARRLAGRFRGTASCRHKAIATRHLRRCGDCRGMYDQLTDIEVALRSVVARAVLGPAAASYLYAARRAAARADVTEVAAEETEEETEVVAVTTSAGAEASAPAEARSLRPAGESRYGSRRLRWLGAGAVAVLAAVATMLLVVLASGNTVLTPTHQAQHPEAAPAPAPPPAIARQPTQTKTSPPSSPSAGHTPSAGVIASPVTSPAARPAPAPPTLSATVDLRSSDEGSTDRVVFTVADTGGIATGELTVWLNLPGSSPGSAQSGSSSEGTNGWACQQTWTGVTCRHDGIQAGSSIGDSLLISVSGPQEACGRPVSLTAVSGEAWVSAQSPEDIQCQQSNTRQFSRAAVSSREILEMTFTMPRLNTCARPTRSKAMASAPAEITGLIWLAVGRLSSRCHAMGDKPRLVLLDDWRVAAFTGG